VYFTGKVFKAKAKTLDDSKAYVMGILNVTPDSFSDGGLYFRPENAIKHAEEMLKDGADIIDVGAYSTRPGSEEITDKEEMRRLSRVLPEIRKMTDKIISVDTFNPETAEYSLENGADAINDVSGKFNPEIASLVKKYGAGWIITHTSNVKSETEIKYKKGVCYSVEQFFDEILKDVEKFGIDKNQICLDAGFGFAKNNSDNIELLKNLETVIRPDVFFLTALSRKRFVGYLSGKENACERDIASRYLELLSLEKGADLIRVHDVKSASELIKVYNSLFKD
jgi:dihydropteroate synthase